MRRSSDPCIRPKPSATAVAPMAAASSPAQNGAKSQRVGGTQSSQGLPADMIFEVTPQEIVFNSFKPNTTYETTITFKNRTRSNQFLRVARPDSHMFSLSAPKGTTSTLKVASGLTVQYKVQFKPEENKDYFCHLTVLTDEEQFSIPVRAFGSRGKLDIPTEFTTEDAPVKGTSRSLLFLRNNGESSCVWKVGVADGSPFTCSPSFGTVPPQGGVTPVEVLFSPHELRRYVESLRFFVGPECDVIQEVSCSGCAVEANIELEQMTVDFPGTFVTTERQAVVRVVNQSDHTVQFTWKSDATATEEKIRAKEMISMASAMDTAGIRPQITVDERKQMDRLEAVSHVKRVFDDEVFSIEPTSGVIYGRGVKEFTVTFSPQLAVPSTSTAYLDITGRYDRIPLQVKGAGMGPQCKLEYTKLHIGDVYMNAIHEYEVEIENVGCVEARYAVIPLGSILGQKFSFSPSNGVLQPGEAKMLRITLQSDLIGVICETFNIHIHGTLEELSLQFKGRIIGPTFQFDIDELDFGNVSYNFWHSRTFQITNTSQVPMNFHLHLPENSPFISHFNIIPPNSVIDPMTAQTIKIEFISNTLGEYDTALLVDVEDVGESVDSLPIKALCLVPPLRVTTDRLHYGRCFVGYDYVMNLEVSNDTAMSGKFEVTMLGGGGIHEMAAVTIGQPNRETSIEVIDPHHKVQVPITLRALSTGNISFSLSIRTIGVEDESPEIVLLTATACGPILELQPSSANFGTIDVLEKVEKIVTVSNTSPIPANCTIRLTKEVQAVVFTVEPLTARIEPFSSLPLKVTACLDEAMTFLDSIELNVQYSEGAFAPIPVKAIGKGFALVPEVDLSDYHFGDIFTDTNITQEVVIFNKGRKDQEVQWHNIRGTKIKDGAPPIVFRMKPERTVIPARGSATFTMLGYASDVGQFSDEFYMKQSGTFKEIMRAKITGNFVAPLISYSTKAIQFDYVQFPDRIDETSDAATIVKSFTMKNITSMPLIVRLHMRDNKSPFSIEGDVNFDLPSGATQVVGVRFNPVYRGDSLSHSCKSKVVVSYANHSSTQFVTVSAKLLFPSIRIEPLGEKINFGTILKDTEERRELVLYNESDTIPATFEWSLENPEDNQVEDTEGVLVKRFDFIPFKGTIPAGGSQQVEAVFYGTSGTHETTATCMVHGGAHYPLRLHGAAGEVQIHFDHTSLDFGVLQYYLDSTKTITVSNPSHVAVNFNVSLHTLKNPTTIKVSPMTGMIQDKLRLQVTFRPSVPDEINEVFTVQVGHFDPQIIRVTGRGQLNTVALLGMDNAVSVSRVSSQYYEGAAIELQRTQPEKRIPYLTKTNSLMVPRGIADPMVLEAERLAYCSTILELGTLPPRETQAEQLALSRSNSVWGQYPPRRSLRRNSTTAGGCVKYVLARYMVDFGHMTRNDSRTTRLRIVNTCPEPLFLMLDSKELAKLPVVVEPMKLPRLNSLAEMTVDVTLDASNVDTDKIHPGENRVEFCLDIKGGPVIVVECRCYVATPVLRISDSVLPFGEVVVGRLNVVPLTLTNEQAVPCEWRLACKESKNNQPLLENGEMAVVAAADKDSEIHGPQFWTNREMGMLAPNESATIEVFFAPFVASSLSAMLTFRFLSNPKTQDVKLTGVGTRCNVVLSPSPVQMPVVRPFQVAHQTIKLINYEDHAVEVCSLNLDVTHLQELHMLDRAVKLAADGRLIFPLRSGGESLPEELLDSIYTNLASKASCLTYKLSEDDAISIGGSSIHGKKSRHTNIGASSVADSNMNSIPDNEHIEIVEAVPEEAHVQPTFVLLVGPPQSGKTTQAARVAENLGYHRVDWNALIAAEAERDTANGEVIRNILTYFASQPINIPSPEKTVIRPSGRLADFANATLQSTLFSMSFRDNDAAIGPAAPSFSRTFDSKALQPAANSSSPRPGSKGANQPPTEPSFPFARFVPSIMKKVLRVHLQNVLHAEPKASFIMDDLLCCLTNDKQMLLDLLKEVCESMEYPLHILSLAVSEATVGLRYASAAERVCHERVQEAFLEPLTEEAFEALTPEAREDYNFKLQYFNECRRELLTTTKRMDHFRGMLKEGPQLSVQESLQVQMMAAKEALESGTRGSRKPTRRGEPERAAPAWDELTPMSAFKELQNSLTRAAAEEIPTAVPPMHLVVVNAESPEIQVTDSILRLVTMKSELSEQHPVSEDLTLVVKSPSEASLCPSAYGGFGDMNVNRIGQWSFFDRSRLQFLQRKNIDYVRFFSKVEREVVVSKKNTKTKTTTLLRRFEERTRWLLPPKSSVDIAVEFCCDKVGEHISLCQFGVVGTLQEIDLKIQANAALPDMSRAEKEIFPVIRPRLTTGRCPSRVFFAAKKLYDFGPLLVPAPLKQRRKSDRAVVSSAGTAPKDPLARGSEAPVEVLSSTETLSFTNKGISEAEVTVQFMNEKEKTFSVSPTKFTLDVGATQQVTLTASPESVGEIQNQLIACVKDNPSPWVVQVTCVGSRPAVTIDDKKECEIDFGRSVLNLTSERTVTLANVSRMPIQWKLGGLEKLPPEIRIDDTTGIIPENGICPLTVVFDTKNTCLHAITLQVIITDPNRPNIIYEVLPLLIRAEGHDVVLEWTREVDFKLMHVGETKKETIRVMNKSPYDVGYMFRVPKRLQGTITVSPQTGTIRGMLGYKDVAIATIEVTAHFDREGEIPRKLGQMEVAFYHPEKKELLYPLQTIPISGEAWYTRFSMKPSTIDFGSCFFNQRKQATFEIRNAGRFPVNYRFFNFKEGCEPLRVAFREQQAAADAEEAVVAKRANTKASKNDADYRIGCFTVSPARGCIPVGEVQSLTVVTVPDEASNPKETLGIYVEQTEPEIEANGVPLELAAHPATPGICADLTSNADVETIFEEQQVVFRLDQFDKCAKAFGKEDGTFSFGTALVGHRVEERFRIANSSPLPCTVVVQLQSVNAASNSSKNNNTLPEGFDLAGVELTGAPQLRLVLPPFESRFVTVGFTASSLHRFEARFVATVENGTDPRTNVLMFCMAGVGTLPNVEYVLPSKLFKVAQPNFAELSTRSRQRDPRRNAPAAVLEPQMDNIQLPLTLIGSHSSRYFIIKNTGVVPAEVRLTKSHSEGIASCVAVQKLNRDISIPVGSQEIFEVEFMPTDVGKGILKLHVALADNPFENKELTVEVHSFSQSISFDNIDPASSDLVDMGDCYLKEPKLHTFSIRNNTAYDLRFAWTTPSIDVAEMVPSVGHLLAGCTKQITARITCSEIGSQRIVPCQVDAEPIDLVERGEWDSAMTNQRWAVAEDENAAQQPIDPNRRTLRRIMEPVAEPAYRLLDAGVFSQALNLGYTCDRPTYDLSLLNNDDKPQQLDVISFPTTKIFQRRIVKLRLTNTGTVALPFNFSVMSRAHFVTHHDAEAETDFTVEPAEGVVSTNTFLDVSVIFAPHAAEESTRALLCAFPHSTRPQLEVPLRGSGECPLIHFQIPQSSYLEKRADGEAGLLDPETLVIEFLTRGLHTKTTMRFKVINPTSTSYHFDWNEISAVGALSPFRCLTPSGSISAGKQLEVAFEFSADTLGTRESKWTFYIQGKASVPFLLVGRAVEPDVFFDNSKLNFGSVNVGTRNEKTLLLENRDDVPFAFSFDKTELQGASSFMAVRPLSGIVGPKEKLPILIAFMPQDEMEYNVPLVCQVKKASTPLTINVKGEGICIHDALQVESLNEEPPIPVTKGQPLIVNLGRVQVDDRVVRNFVLSNNGQYPYDYMVTFHERRFITIDNVVGTVQPKQRAVVTFTYKPSVEESLRQFRMQFKIGKKVTYHVGIQGTTYIPKLNLSFDRYDFGPRFITSYTSGGEVSTVLTLTNNDKELITVDCTFSEGNEWCELDKSSFVARPNDVSELKLVFTPREVRTYEDKLKLVLNGVYSMYLPILGEGVVPRVEVMNHFAKLGVARIGDKREVEMKLECRSRIPTPVSFVGCLDEDLVRKGVSVSAQNILLKPKEIRTIGIVFKPQQRMGEFQREMKMLVCGKEFPFALLSGACEDSEIHLDVTTLKFPDVVVGSSATRRIVIMNSGDISQKFTWNGLRTGELIVSPPTGFIRSHTEFICELHYTPKSADSHIQRSVNVDFDNSPPMSVTVDANAISRPPAKGILIFNCRARETVEQRVTIENTFNQPWVIEPILDHSSWTVAKSITIKQRSKADLVISYHPMKPTKEDDIDVAALFIPRPDGTGMTYTLEGQAEAPGPSGPMQEITVEARTPHTVRFNVNNWSPAPLRFTRDLTWTPEPEDGLISVKGPSGIEVPPNSNKEYTLVITSMREGVYHGTISFNCAERMDMVQFYEFSLQTASQPRAETVEMQAAVRSSAVYNIPVSNPLNKPVTATCKLEGPADAITVAATVTIPAKSAVNIPVEFFPLIHKDFAPVKLAVTCPELGSTNYVLRLTSTQGVPEKVTRLVCPLGHTITFALKFTHFARSNTDYTVRIGEGAQTKNAVFNKIGQGSSIKAPAAGRPKGLELSCDFSYEPQSMGTLKEVIEFTSPAGGTYSFPIMATCGQPQRQGPFMMRPGQTTSLPFKNVFTEPISITAVTDSPLFIVTKKTEIIAAKKAVNVSVQCKMDDSIDVARGKLVVACTPPSCTAPLEWTYYLECSRPEGAASSGPRKSLSRRR